MFIRTKTTPNSPRRSVQIVDGSRDQKTGKVKQKILRHVGIAMDESEEIKLKDLAQEIMKKMAREQAAKATQDSLFPVSEDEIDGLSKPLGRPKKKSIEDVLPTSEVKLSDISEEKRIIEGIHEVAGHVFDQMYGKLCTEKTFSIPEKSEALLDIQAEKKEVKPLSASAYDRLRDVVLGRLADPCSKHKTHQQLIEKFDKEHDLDAIYRMMSGLDSKIELIKDLTFEKTRSLFPRGISILLFDVTTLYFESVEEDDLRAFGYSKDHRFNTTQVVLALATNTEGLPIGYELFEGNCAEVKTLMASINRWKERFSIDSVCFVADRAMMSHENVQLLEVNQCQYIIAAKLKGLPEELKEEILAGKNYKPAMIEDQLNWLGEFEYVQKTKKTKGKKEEEKLKSQRLIVTYKSDRARRDKYQREQVLKKASKVLGENKSTKNLISNAGLKQYLKIGEATAEIDPDKISKAEAWDGMHGILTNMKEADARELRARYSRLWKIEESFRINKHTLKMRPIFHWKSERIRAHVAICYMAFSVLRHLEYQVNLTQKISVQKILESLINVQASIHVHKITKDRYRLPSVFPLMASKIYKTFDLKRSQDAEPYLI